MLTGRPASAQFMHETQFEAIPYDVDVTPNGLIAVVRGNSSAVVATNGSDQRVSFWRTDVTSSALAKVIPNVTNAVGRGNLTNTSVGGFPRGTFANAIAVNNERAVLIGSGDADFNGSEDTTYVDVVSFNYTQDPPTVTVLSTTVLGGGTGSGTMAGLAHDVAITPDGVLAVVTHRNWIHVFEMMTGTQVAAFNVGGTGSPSSAGPCNPGFSRNSLEVTNDHAVVTMARSVSTAPPNEGTWVYVVDLSYSPPTTLPTLVLEHEPYSGNITERKPHDLAISPNGALAGISSWGVFALYDLTSPTPAFVGGNLNSFRWKDTEGCFPVWDSIEMSDSRAIVLSDQTMPYALSQCELKGWWVAQVYAISTTSASLLASFDDSDVIDPASIEYYGNPTWDMTLSDDGTIAAIHNWGSHVALVDVDTSSPSLERFLGWGSHTGPPAPGAPPIPNPAYRVNDTVAITRGYVTPSTPANPLPGTHRWIAYLQPFATAPTESFLYLHDLPQFQAGTPTTQIIEHSDPGTDTWGVELELNASQTEVLVRNLGLPDEANPAAGGRDWYRYNAQNPQWNPPFQVGTPFGGKGFSIGVDNLIQRRGVAVSISADILLANKGYVHVVRTF